MRKCDSCGKIYQESKDVFCPHCGAVAQKQCSHSSSFDSKRYDRGEIYKNNNSQYQDTTYNKGFEPHAQRDQAPYKTFDNKDDYGDKPPKIKFPDLTKVFSKGKSINGKYIGLIGFCIVIAFNFITGLLSYSDDVDYSSGYEDVSEQLEYMDQLYAVINKATIKVDDTDGDFKSFTLEISGMEFAESIPDSMDKDITSGATAKAILSEDTFVEMLICDFSKKIVEEESYNNALNDAYLVTGEQVEGKCRYEFTYSFDYDEIVNFVGGVDFYLGDGMYINAELPFSAFSVSEDGEITYYTSYADSGTAWNTVFEECSNKREITSDIRISFEEDE